MNKVAIQVSGGSSFVAEVTREAARLDRSPSWLLSHCLGATLPKLSSSMVAVSAPKKPLRTKKSAWTFYVPTDLMEHCRRLAARLGMTSDDVLAWAWQAGRDDVRAMPSS